MNLPAAAMPVNAKGQRVGVGEYNRSDGFSPGSALRPEAHQAWPSCNESPAERCHHMLHPNGLASHPAFQAGGHSILDTSHLYYDGNSQGGIMGGMTTALAPDYRRAVLGVSGMNYGGVLLLRSTDFKLYAAVLYKAYTDVSLHPLILDLMQQLWDRGEPDGEHGCDRARAR